MREFLVAAAWMAGGFVFGFVVVFVAAAVFYAIFGRAEK